MPNDGVIFRRLPVLLAILCGILFILKLLVVIWSLDKGFDLTDEGLYMLLLRRPESDPYLFWYQYLILQAFGWLDITVVNFRAVRVVLEVFSAMLLAWAAGWVFFGKNKRAFRYFLLTFALLGTFLTLFSRAVSYYDLHQFNLFVATALISLGLAKSSQEKTPWLAYCLFLLAGWFSGLQFFVKFTASLLYLGAFVLISWYLFKGTFLKKIKPALVYVGGYLAGLLSYIPVYGSKDIFNHWFTAFKEARDVIGYDPVFLVRLYFEYDLMPAVGFLIIPLGLGWLSFYGFRRSGRNGLVKNAVELSFVVLITCFLVVCLVLNVPFYSDLAYKMVSYSSVYSVYGYLLWIIWGFWILWGMPSRGYENSWESRKQIAMLLLILSLPFIISIGTLTPNSRTIYAYLVPFFITGGWLIARFHELNRKALAVGLALAFTVLSQGHFVYNYIFRPYRLGGNLLEQNITLNPLNGRDKLQVDYLTYEFYSNIENIMQYGKYTMGDPIIAFGDLPGIIYLLDGYSPGTPWYYASPLSINFVCDRLEKLQPGLSYDKKPFVMGYRNLPPEMVKCIHNSVLYFPDTYKQIGTVWHPFARQEVYIYKPIGGR